MNIESMVEMYYTKKGIDFVYSLTTLYRAFDRNKRIKLSPNKTTPNSHFIGICKDIEKFRKILLTDEFDISEGGSNEWAVIEVLNTGIALPSISFSPESIEEWYRYNRTRRAYVRMRKPKWANGIVGWNS